MSTDPAALSAALRAQQLVEPTGAIDGEALTAFCDALATPIALAIDAGGGGGGASLPILLGSQVSGVLPVANGGTASGTAPAGGFAGLTALGSEASTRAADDLILAGAISSEASARSSGDAATLASAANASLLTSGTVALARMAPFATRGAFGSRPAAGTAGRLYLASDSPILSYDDGAAWQHYGPIYPLTQPPLVSSFTSINNAGRATTSTDVGGAIRISATNVVGAAGLDLRCLSKAAPGATFTITACVLPLHIPLSGNAGNALFGVFGRKTSNGSITMIDVYNNNGSIGVARHRQTANNNGTSPTFTNALATLVGGVQVAEGAAIWLRVKVTATDVEFYFSTDGQNFGLVFSDTFAAFIQPDECGIAIGAGAGNTIVSALFLSLEIV